MEDNEKRFNKFHIGQVVYDGFYNVFGVIIGIDLNPATPPCYDIIYQLKPYGRETITIVDGEDFLSLEEFSKCADKVVAYIKSMELKEWL